MMLTIALPSCERELMSSSVIPRMAGGGDGCVAPSVEVRFGVDIGAGVGIVAEVLVCSSWSTPVLVTELAFLACLVSYGYTIDAVEKIWRQEIWLEEGQMEIVRHRWWGIPACNMSKFRLLVYILNIPSTARHIGLAVGLL